MAGSAGRPSRHPVDGTATLSGTPITVGHKQAAGTYRDKIRASFAYGGSSKTITQVFILTVS